MNIQYPSITDGTPLEQMQQIRSYLFQLVEQLNMESDTEEMKKSEKSLFGTRSAAGTDPDTATQNPTPASTFNQVKNLIIKSADIVDAYYTEINRRLTGVYVAESEYGKYTQKTDKTISDTAGQLAQMIKDIRRIDGSVNAIIDTKANIRIGELFVVGDETLEPELGKTPPVGSPVYGVEVGQVTVKDGKEAFNKFARFTSYGMTLYDNNGNLTAYITDSRLHIPNAVIKNSLRRGGFIETINSDGSSVERWVGV